MITPRPIAAIDARIESKAVIVALFVLVALCQAACSGKGATSSNTQKIAVAEGKIGPAGGVIAINAPTSSLRGGKVVVPAGALDQTYTLDVYEFPKSELESLTENLSPNIRYFGGLEISAGNATASKPLDITLPNTFEATPDNQLLVAQAMDLDGKSSLSLVYQGMAQVGSILFNAPAFGSYGVLSPTPHLAVIQGTLRDSSGALVSNGIVGTIHSSPFVALTDSRGYFEIPAGPTGTRTAVIGLPPTEKFRVPSSPIEGPGVIEIDIPNISPPFPAPIPDIIANIILDRINLPDPPIPPPCQCDPQPSMPSVTSREYPASPFTISKDTSIHIFLYGLERIYIPNTSYVSNTDFFKLLPIGTANLFQSITLTTEDNTIATVSPSGLLTTISEGETRVDAFVNILDMKTCVKDGKVAYITCPYFFQAAPARVKVDSVGGVWKIIATGTSQGCTAHTPCQTDPPFLCGTAICGNFTIISPDIHVNQEGTEFYASEEDINGHAFSLTGSQKGSAITFTIQGTGFTPGIGPATTTYTGTRNGNRVTGTFSGFASWTYANPQGTLITETATWNGTFTSTIQ
jgi:hypothetical protein